MIRRQDIELVPEQNRFCFACKSIISKHNSNNFNWSRIKLMNYQCNTSDYCELFRNTCYYKSIALCEECTNEYFGKDILFENCKPQLKSYCQLCDQIVDSRFYKVALFNASNNTTLELCYCINCFKIVTNNVLVFDEEGCGIIL